MQQRLDAGRGDEQVEEVRPGRVRLTAEGALRGTARRRARQMALGLGGERGAARVRLHRLLVGVLLSETLRTGSADPGGQAVHGVLEFAVGAQGEGGDGDGGGAAAVLQVERGPDLVRLAGAPLLPGLHHGGGLRPGPRHVCRHGLRGGVGIEAQLGDDAGSPCPAPRRAQKRSLFSLAFATTCLPSAVIRVAWVRLSQVRPIAVNTTPWPPPRVRDRRRRRSGRKPARMVTRHPSRRARGRRRSAWIRRRPPPRSRRTCGWC